MSTPTLSKADSVPSKRTVSWDPSVIDKASSTTRKKQNTESSGCPLACLYSSSIHSSDKEASSSSSRWCCLDSVVKTVKPYWDGVVEFCTPYLIKIRDCALSLWSRLFSSNTQPQGETGEGMEMRLHDVPPSGGRAMHPAQEVIDRLHRQEQERQKSAASAASEQGDVKAPHAERPAPTASLAPGWGQAPVWEWATKSLEEILAAQTAISEFQKTYATGSDVDASALLRDLDQLYCKWAIVDALKNGYKLRDRMDASRFIFENPKDEKFRQAIAAEVMSANVAYTRKQHQRPQQYQQYQQPQQQIQQPPSRTSRANLAASEAHSDEEEPEQPEMTLAEEHAPGAGSIGAVVRAASSSPEHPNGEAVMVEAPKTETEEGSEA